MELIAEVNQKLRVKDVAAELGITEKMARSIFDRPEFPSVRLSQKTRVVERKKFDAWMDRGGFKVHKDAPHHPKQPANGRWR